MSSHKNDNIASQLPPLTWQIAITIAVADQYQPLFNKINNYNSLIVLWIYYYYHQCYLQSTSRLRQSFCLFADIVVCTVASYQPSELIFQALIHCVLLHTCCGSCYITFVGDLKLPLCIEDMQLLKIPQICLL